MRSAVYPDAMKRIATVPTRRSRLSITVDRPQVQPQKQSAKRPQRKGRVGLDRLAGYELQPEALREGGEDDLCLHQREAPAGCRRGRLRRTGSRRMPGGPRSARV